MKELDDKIKALEEAYDNAVGTETGVFARITGYFRPVESWCIGKKEEYKDRKEYLVKKAKKNIKYKEVQA